MGVPGSRTAKRKLEKKGKEVGGVIPPDFKFVFTKHRKLMTVIFAY